MRDTARAVDVLVRNLFVARRTHRDDFNVKAQAVVKGTGVTIILTGTTASTLINVA